MAYVLSCKENFVLRRIWGELWELSVFSVVVPTSVSEMIEVKSEGFVILTDCWKSWMQAEEMVFYDGIYIKCPLLLIKLYF